MTDTIDRNIEAKKTQGFREWFFSSPEPPMDLSGLKAEVEYFGACQNTVALPTDINWRHVAWYRPVPIDTPDIAGDGHNPSPEITVGTA